MTAEPPESPVTEAVRSLEVRWISPAAWRRASARRPGRGRYEPVHCAGAEIALSGLPGLL